MHVTQVVQKSVWRSRVKREDVENGGVCPRKTKRERLRWCKNNLHLMER